MYAALESYVAVMGIVVLESCVAVVNIAAPESYVAAMDTAVLESYYCSVVEDNAVSVAAPENTAALEG